MEVHVPGCGTAPLPPGKRSKAKAPAPPTFSKHVESSSIAKNQEGENLTMEPKDNVLNAHIDLIVVLPGGEERSTSVNGSKPMMDLLIFLCGKYHLNPSSHTIELVGREKNQIRFKPNTLIGTLEVEKVILKEKNVEEKKKPTSVVPEQTVRVVVNYKKTQKTIVRVSPLVPLQELIPVISNKCEFDPSSTILVKDFEYLELYDLTKSLNELGLREVCAVDTSMGLPQHDFQGGSFQQEQPLVSGNLNLEKENKGFFNIFRLSKKKREKPTSAPATPLISPQRPLGMSSSSAYCPTYESNTLPSDLPKKRRAPAPPQRVPQSLPRESSQKASARPTSCVFSDVSLNECAQDMTGPCRQRAGSLPHSEVTTSSNPSVKKKRKAPLPPSKTPEGQKIPDSNLGSSPTPDATDKTFAAKISSTLTDDQAVVGSECNLEEIVEMEETRAPDTDAANGIVQTEEALSPHVTIDNPSKNAQTSVSDNLDVDKSTATDKDAEMKSENRVSAAENIVSQTAMEKDNNSVMENVDKDLSAVNSGVEENVNHEMHPKASDEISGTCCLIPSDKGITGTLIQADISTDMTTSLLSKDSTSFQLTNVTVKDQQKKSDRMEINEVKFEEVISEEVNNFQQAHSAKTANGTITPSHDKTLKNISENVDNSEDNFSLPLSSKQQKCESVSMKSTDPTVQNFSSKEDLPVSNQPITEPLTFSHSCDAQSTKEAVIRPETPTKIPIIYRSESEPKPKPSNEITREYIPKIGMTTYKIVPPKSLEKSSPGILPEAETVDQQTPTYDYVPASDTSKQSSSHSNETEGSVASVAREKTDIHQGARNNVLKSESTDSATHSPKAETAISNLVVDNESEPHKEKVIKRTQSASNNKMKPGSAFLQLHKRISGQYVTSALARSSSLPSQASLDIEKEENGVSFQDLSPTNTIDGEIIIPPPPEFAGTSEEKVQNKMSKSGGTSASRPSQPPKVPKKPSIRVNLSDTKSLRTTVASKTYTPTSPSPFALAVSSAVRKTQTNTMYSFKPKPVEASSSNQSSLSDFGNTELHQSSSIPKESNNSNISKQISFPEREIKKDCNIAVAETQPQHIQPQMPSPLRNTKPPLTSQITDPGQIHQAVLDAIRSGEGAAKLRKAKTFTTM
ncbi:cordon-bleu protein-like 1b [Pristis pectinata]|uniref:cordon-bleu protein-like 1b n=1 Tax=Pristis pectinata TaxID=685728 RepID=UPI00223D9DAB|nr:cordon-bleu protein-like 1b [Pristis pectinata]XP_051876451.1 cordon-bleu protein-like 1b [Pristis pectinata]